jgi:hypothetical protein
MNVLLERGLMYYYYSRFKIKKSFWLNLFVENIQMHVHTFCRSQWPRDLRLFVHLKAEIVGSNPTQRHGCLCMRLFCVSIALCVGSGLATG